MLRAAFICFFLSVYILFLGPPLLIYTLITRHVDPLYWAGVNGVMFFVRCVGVRVHVKGTERIPKGTVIFAANHTSSADAPAVVWSIPRRIAILLKRSLFEWPIVGQAFHLAHFIPVDRHNRDSAIISLEKATEALRNGQSFLIYPEGTRSPDWRLLSRCQYCSNAGRFSIEKRSRRACRLFPWRVLALIASWRSAD